MSERDLASVLGEVGALCASGCPCVAVCLGWRVLDTEALPEGLTDDQVNWIVARRQERAG